MNTADERPSAVTEIAERPREIVQKHWPPPVVEVKYQAECVCSLGNDCNYSRLECTAISAAKMATYGCFGARKSQLMGPSLAAYAGQGLCNALILFGAQSRLLVKPIRGVRVRVGCPMNPMSCHKSTA